MKHVETFRNSPVVNARENNVRIKNINLSGKYIRSTFFMLIKIECRVYRSTQCLCERFAFPIETTRLFYEVIIFYYLYIFLIWNHYVMAGIFVFIQNVKVGNTYQKVISNVL